MGVADAGSGQAFATDALLPIASIGKAMTAVALLREAQAGRVDLDAAVHDLLPWLPLPTPFGPTACGTCWPTRAGSWPAWAPHPRR